MTINKTEEFVYFQNKAKHYDTIRNIKPSVRNKLESRYIKTMSHSPQYKYPSNKKNLRLVPLMRQIQVKQQNQNLINRLFQMYKSERTQVSAQGNYSRYNRDDRKFRQTNPYKAQLNRTIQIGNQELEQRIKKIRPRIGNSIQWEKHFGKTLSLKKNISKYLLDSHRSKGSLHISLVDNYVPKYYQTFLNTSSVVNLDKNGTNSVPKQIQITYEGLLVLPDIKSKSPNGSHVVRQLKNSQKLIFDRSQKSFNLIKNKSQYSVKSSVKVQNPQSGKEERKKETQRQPKRRFLQFKFSEVKKNLKSQKVDIDKQGEDLQIQTSQNKYIQKKESSKNDENQNNNDKNKQSGQEMK